MKVRFSDVCGFEDEFMDEMEENDHRKPKKNKLENESSDKKRYKKTKRIKKDKFFKDED